MEIPCINKVILSYLILDDDQRTTTERQLGHATEPSEVTRNVYGIERFL